MSSGLYIHNHIVAKPTQITYSTTSKFENQDITRGIFKYFSLLNLSFPYIVGVLYLLGITQQSITCFCSHLWFFAEVGNMWIHKPGANQDSHKSWCMHGIIKPCWNSSRDMTHGEWGLNLLCFRMPSFHLSSTHFLYFKSTDCSVVFRCHNGIMSRYRATDFSFPCVQGKYLAVSVTASPKF